MPTSSNLNASYAAELVLRADDLQEEARALVADLDLLVMLGRAGHTEQIGSTVSGLMVVRDLDLQVIAPGLSTDRAFNTMRPLLARTQVLDARYANERGSRSPTGRPEDERYYFVLHYLTDEGREWKMDISFWVGNAPREQRAQTEQLARRLTEETRLAILWIKDVWRHLPTYPDEVSGMDVYDAVLEQGVRTPDQFAAYLALRGKPIR